jgi:hypothetical protein
VEAGRFQGQQAGGGFPIELHARFEAVYIEKVLDRKKPFPKQHLYKSLSPYLAEKVEFRCRTLANRRVC